MPACLQIGEGASYFSPEGFAIPARAALHRGCCARLLVPLRLACSCANHQPARPLYLSPRHRCPGPASSPHKQIDGGDPMVLDGDVVLCARSDDPSGRHFDGRLAYLGLYDAALEEGQVA